MACFFVFLSFVFIVYLFLKWDAFLKLHSKCGQRRGPGPGLEPDEWPSGKILTS